MKYFRKFIFKVIILLLFFIGIMQYLDIRQYVAYDKKDGKSEVENITNKNNNLMEKIKNIINK